MIKTFKFLKFQQDMKHILRVSSSLGGGIEFNLCGFDHLASHNQISCFFSLYIYVYNQ